MEKSVTRTVFLVSRQRITPIPYKMGPIIQDSGRLTTARIRTMTENFETQGVDCG
jgi:hypothetical protein